MWAARVYGLADMAARTGQSQDPRRRVTKIFTTELAAMRAEVRARLGDNAFAQALVEGQTMTVEDLQKMGQKAPRLQPGDEWPLSTCGHC